MTRLPALYLPHGGGPWPFVEMGIPRAEVDALAGFLRNVPGMCATPPRALLVVTAHWEEAVPTVSPHAAPGMLYDYYGFPADAYTVQWSAKGDPDLARRVLEHLRGAGFRPAEDPARGFDHGTFVPMKVAWPAAEVPCVQLSLVRGLDPETHLRMGRALAPLREQGVFILGSGMSFHNMRAFGDPRALGVSQTFDAWLRETVALPRSAREARLLAWADAPAARACHPREEHLLPLMVVAGAGGDDAGTVPWIGRVLGTQVSAARFG
jgi:aromatic ring-opening dioxygenase catalytic subunit (LigB family)